jgi:hypothetical protein
MAQQYGTPEYRLYRQANRYGMTVSKMSAMLVAQNYECAICRKNIKDSKFNIDHDPDCCDGGAKRNTCGKCNRAILCHYCNIVVGHIENAIHDGHLQKIIEYIGKGD